MVHPGAGRPEITGGVLSILIVTETELLKPAPLVAEQVIFVPAVSAVSVTGPQPVEVAIPDSGSVTDQEIVTLLRYHVLFPNVPEMIGVTRGGVVSPTLGFARNPCWIPAASA